MWGRVERSALGCGWTRRGLLRLILAFGLWTPLAGRATARVVPPEKMRPQPGDRFVFAPGARGGETVRAEHLQRDAAPVSAYPVDPASGVVRDGSRLNQVMLVRLDPAALSSKTVSAAANGLVAYSAVCTHTGCDVSEWRGEARVLICPCHGSEFEAVNAAKVAKGPAPKPLAMLPLEIADGELRVSRGFTRRVGFQIQ